MNDDFDDECSQCGWQYKFQRGSCDVYVFIEHPQCNHVDAVCPKCGYKTRIYISSDAVLHFLEVRKLKLCIGPRASEELQEEADSMWEQALAQDTPEGVERDLDEVPEDLLRELHDDLRRFGEEGMAT